MPANRTFAASAGATFRHSFMPKIAFVHSNNNDVGGSDLAMWRVVCACRDAGYDTLVVISRRNLIWERYERERIAIQQVPMPRLSNSLNPFILS